MPLFGAAKLPGADGLGIARVECLGVGFGAIFGGLRVWGLLPLVSREWRNGVQL